MVLLLCGKGDSTSLTCLLSAHLGQVVQWPGRWYHEEDINPRIIQPSGYIWDKYHKENVQPDRQAYGEGPS